MTAKCCERLRGDLLIGPPLQTNGQAYEATTGYGVSYGTLYGGFGGIAQTLPKPAMPNPMRWLGDASLTIEHDLATVEAVQPHSLEFDDACADTTLRAVKLQIELRCLDLQNNALRHGAAPTTILSAAVTNELLPLANQNAGTGDFISFARGLVDLQQPVVVQVYDVASSTLVSTLVQDVDYSLRQNGFRPLQAISLAATQVLRVSYVSQTRSQFSVADFCQCTHSLQFMGRNMPGAACDDADQTGRVNFQFYRCTLVPDGSYEVMPTDSFSTIKLNALVVPVYYGGKKLRYFREQT